MLSLDKLGRSDMEDGSLEQFLLSAHPLSILILAKVVAHWLVTGLPLLLVSPLLAVFFDLPAQATTILILTLLLGTPVLSLIGAIGVALTVGLRSGGVLLSLLVLPLYIPVLIFSCIAVDMSMTGLPVDAHLKILSAMLFLSLALAPWPAAAALKISLN
jgi:heme exporter protein B